MGAANDRHVPPARRLPVTRKANVVIAGGVVSGTWVVKAKQLSVTWFGEHGKPRLDALEEQVARVAGMLERPLRLSVDAV